MKAIQHLAEFTLVSGIDSSGVYGGLFHYALVLAMVGSALLAFLYFWSKGRLDMDEGPKLQMMRDEDKEECNGDQK